MAGTVVETISRKRGDVTIYSLAWTSSAGGEADHDISEDIDGEVILMVTDPGATAPTADYDIALNDEDGCDVLGGEGGDRHTSTSEQVFPKAGNNQYLCDQRCL